MTINRSAHPEALWPGVQAWFGNNYKELNQGWETHFDKRSSDKAYEKLVEGTQFGYAPVKGEGSALTYDDARQGYTSQITHAVYALGYVVTMEELADGQYKELSRGRSKALGRSLRATREYVHANVFNRAFSGSYVGGDNVAMCSTSHPTRAGNQANRPTVDADLTEASLEDMVILAQNAKNARGLRIDLTPQRLVIPLQLQFTATRILKSQLQSGSANNDVNALKEMGLLPKGIATWRYLDDPDAWFLTTDCDDALVHFERMDIELEQDNDFDTKNARASAMMRFSCGWGDWRGVYGTQGA